MFSGLSEQEVIERRQKYGENSLPIKEGVPWPLLLLTQIKNPLIGILLLVGLVSLLLREFFDVGLIGAVVILNILMSFFQEYDAQKTLLALRKILKPTILVIRGGLRKRVETKELVPGDLAVLGAGDRIPADGRLLEGTNLLVNEAILTGEEEAVAKNTESKNNRLFMGTMIIFGQGIMEIDAIGQETEVGKIGLSLGEIKEEPTPLQIKLNEFSRDLVKFILVVCFFIFLLGLFYQHNFWEMARLAVVLSVAAIPEGLPVAITVILVLGIRKILKRQGLVKRLLSIETLGSTSVICTDKTGTLTEGKMKVVEADFVDQTKGLLALMLTNTQRTNIEIAFWDHAQSQKHLLPQGLWDSAVKVYEEPFDSEKKYAMTIHKVNDIKTSYIVGAAEIVLSFCQSPKKTEVLGRIEEWANRGLKVVGIAYKDKGELKDKSDYEWLGLVGIEDPVREGVREAMEKAKEAGIEIKIVTGDFRKTAERVAAVLGIKISDNQIMEGKELEEIREEDLKKKIGDILLFSRVTPHQKLKIIKALQEKGEVVAMTGDGVNDAPALKKADIGVVVGTGSEVAKEASDLVLLDNNFKTIVAAVEEGRLIFANIKKVVAYVLSNAFAEIVLILSAMILHLPAPLTVVQILWIHLICDGPPDILLSFEPKENGLMEKNPQELTRANILGREVKLIIILVSLSTGLTAFALFFAFYRLTENLALAQTMAFVTLACVSLVYIFSFKNLSRFVLRTENFFANKYLFLGVAYGFILILLAVYLPGLNTILGTIPLAAREWFLIIGTSIGITALVEVLKLGNYFSSK